jgi:hypothetical protein
VKDTLGEQFLLFPGTSRRPNEGPARAPLLLKLPVK